MIEAMKQALEAFEALQSHGDIAILVTPEREFNFARISKELRQAIAEAEKQEPVAWMHPDGRIWTFGRGFDKSTFTIPLYTHPQPKREWVGLTDEEIEDLLSMFFTGDEQIKAIEAKLKEKNT